MGTIVSPWRQVLAEYAGLVHMLMAGAYTRQHFSST